MRIPDLSVFSRELPVEQVFTRPQLIAIEVLSPEDRHSWMDTKIRDYLDFSVRHVWVVDSATRAGWDCSDGNWARKERFELVGGLRTILFSHWHPHKKVSRKIGCSSLSYDHHFQP